MTYLFRGGPCEVIVTAFSPELQRYQREKRAPGNAARQELSHTILNELLALDL